MKSTTSARVKTAPLVSASPFVARLSIAATTFGESCSNDSSNSSKLFLIANAVSQKIFANRLATDVRVLRFNAQCRIEGGIDNVSRLVPCKLCPDLDDFGVVVNIKDILIDVANS